MVSIPGNELVRLIAIVEGRVQGVGFRYFVLNQAQSLELTGWVRNTFSGNVEVVAEGHRVALEELLSMLNKGPRSAFVTKVQEKWDSYTGEFPKFSVRSTF